jgi:hypothetical protein
MLELYEEKKKNIENVFSDILFGVRSQDNVHFALYLYLFGFV